MSENMQPSFFPMKIRLVATGEEIVVQHPDELPNGPAFVVLITRVQGETSVSREVNNG